MPIFHKIFKLFRGTKNRQNFWEKTTNFGPFPKFTISLESILRKLSWCSYKNSIITFLFESYWDTHSKISWKFHKHWTWFGWGIIDLKIVFCVCLFVFCYFCLNNFGIPTETFPKHFIRIRLDLAEILSI